MLKGINKQIIEIKCPESENFDRILLFVKCDRGEVPLDELGREVYGYYHSFVGKSGFENKNRTGSLSALKILIIAGTILAGLTGLLAVSLIL